MYAWLQGTGLQVQDHEAEQAQACALTSICCTRAFCSRLRRRASSAKMLAASSTAACCTAVSSSESCQQPASEMQDVADTEAAQLSKPHHVGRNVLRGHLVVLVAQVRRIGQQAGIKGRHLPSHALCAQGEGSNVHQAAGSRSLTVSPPAQGLQGKQGHRLTPRSAERPWHSRQS